MLEQHYPWARTKPISPSIPSPSTKDITSNLDFDTTTDVDIGATNQPPVTQHSSSLPKQKHPMSFQAPEGNHKLYPSKAQASSVPMSCLLASCGCLGHLLASKPTLGIHTWMPAPLPTYSKGKLHSSIEVSTQSKSTKLPTTSKSTLLVRVNLVNNSPNRHNSCVSCKN